MKFPRFSTTLTPENAESIAKFAALIGWTRDHLANHLLTKTLEEFANRNSGLLEGFSGAIYYPDRASTQHALHRVPNDPGKLNGHLPDSFKSEIFERPEGAVRSHG